MTAPPDRSADPDPAHGAASNGLRACSPFPRTAAAGCEAKTNLPPDGALGTCAAAVRLPE
ncbi:MAG: hypothetical protein H6700_12440 [Myxococcales bacterium]|nr:hypothetical protein [Myxococcales bacterium]